MAEVSGKATASFTALDGATVTVTAGGVDLSSPFSANIRVIVDKTLVEFVSALRDDLFEVALAQDLALQPLNRASDRPVWTATAEQTDSTGRIGDLEYGLLEGDLWAVQGHAYNLPLGTVPARFDRFVFNEREDGVSFIPRDPVATPYADGCRVLKGVAGLGLIECQQITRESVGLLPSTSGARTQHGEIYVDQESEDGSPSRMLYVSDSAYAYLTLDTRSPEDELMAAVDSLSIDWIAA